MVMVEHDIPSRNQDGVFHESVMIEIRNINALRAAKENDNSLLSPLNVLKMPHRIFGAVSGTLPRIT